MNETHEDDQASPKLNLDDVRMSLDDIYTFEPKETQVVQTDRQFERGISNVNRNRNQFTSSILPRGIAISQDKISKVSKHSQYIPSSDRPSLRNTQRMNICLDNYDYYEKRIVQNNMYAISHRTQSPSSKEDGISEASNIVQRDLSNLEDLSFQEFDLQTEIDQTEEMGIVKLPDHPIKVEQIRITKPITIVGTSSSSIEVSSSILVDLSKYPKANRKVAICECTIYFEYLNKKNLSSQLISTKRFKESGEFRVQDKKSYSDNINANQSHYMGGQITMIQKNETISTADQKFYPLFTVWPNSALEVRDCTITSRNTDTSVQNMQDVCFYLKRPDVNDLVDVKKQPCLSIQSTMVHNFYTAIQNSMMGRISLEKMYILNSRNHSIDISNAFILEVKECTIENAAKSCVNLRFSKDLSCLDKMNRSILIEKSEFKRGKSYGISVFGENMIYQRCSLKLAENKIHSCLKDGIGIKNLNIDQVTIEKNEISNNHGNGIILRNLFDTISFSQTKLTENKIIDSQLYGLAVVNTACYAENNEITQNMKGGILISSGDNSHGMEEVDFFKKYPLRNIFNSNNVNQNRDSGVIIVGALKGPILFNSCKIYENTNGLYVRQGNESSTKKTTGGKGEKTEKTEIAGDIVLDKCSLFENLVSGVHVKSVLNKMYLKETAIYGNRSYAVFIQKEEEKDRLVFKGDKSKAKEFIFGYVGGSWGVLYDHNYNICKTNKCNLF